VTNAEKPSSKATKKQKPAGKKAPGTVIKPKEKGRNQADDDPAVRPGKAFILEIRHILTRY
jgi:hypothetical protein